MNGNLCEVIACISCEYFPTLRAANYYRWRMIKTKHFNFNRNIQKFAHLIIDAEVDRVVSCIAFIRYVDDAGRGSLMFPWLGN